jgi:hypothetical protein
MQIHPYKSIEPDSLCTTRARSICRPQSNLRWRENLAIRSARPSGTARNRTSVPPCVRKSPEPVQSFRSRQQCLRLEFPHGDSRRSGKSRGICNLTEVPSRRNWQGNGDKVHPIDGPHSPRITCAFEILIPTVCPKTPLPSVTDRADRGIPTRSNPLSI